MLEDGLVLVLFVGVIILFFVSCSVSLNRLELYFLLLDVTEGCMRIVLFVNLSKYNIKSAIFTK